MHAARYARENNVPYLGLCLGMQVMVVEFARDAFDTDDVNSTEFDPETPHPVISLLDEQQGIVDKGGTMRLGGYVCRLVPAHARQRGLRRPTTCQRAPPPPLRVQQRVTASELDEAGLVASGTSPDGSLVEICEIRDHPFMVGTQFHPEFRSRPNRPHPLFAGFLQAALAHSNGRPSPARESRARHASSSGVGRTLRAR